MTSHAMTFEDYPEEALRTGQQGSVQVRYLIAIDGHVPECMVTESSGKELLDKAACAMVMKRWKFRPALQQGMPVQVWINGTVTFRLL
jgi:protein TonB